MSGALLQLVAVGAQDALLMGDQNKITFFELNTRSHTNFAVESIDQTVNGKIGFGRSISATISRNGDLISRVYVQATLPELTVSDIYKSRRNFSWIPNVGHHLIEEASIEIGGQVIDSHYGEWLDIWNELSSNQSHKFGYNRMIGNVPELLSDREPDANLGNNFDSRLKLPEYQLLIPLQFWFCKSPGLALPLIALQYHEVKINIKFRQRNDLLRTIKNYESNSLINLIGDEKKRQTVTDYSTGLPFQIISDDDTNPEYRIRWQLAEGETLDNYTKDAKIWKGIEIEEVPATSGLFQKKHGDKEGKFSYDDFVDDNNAFPIFNSSATTFTVPSDTTKIDDDFNKENIILGRYWDKGFEYSLSGKDLEVQLWVDYIYLDNDERKRFATTPHNYLIEQLQCTGRRPIYGSHARYELNFNHPVKELVWFVESEQNPFGIYSYPSYKNVQIIASNYEKKKKEYKMSGSNLSEQNDIRYFGESPIESSKLILNGHDRFKERSGLYFDSVQSYQHHRNSPERPGINVYSFGIKPEDIMPTGTCNFSRIDNSFLEINYKPEALEYNSGTDFFRNSNLVVYAVNYNQLKIISGMGGLTFSN